MFRCASSCHNLRLVLVSLPAAIDAAFIGFLAQDSCCLSDVTLNSHYLLEIISRLSLAEPLPHAMHVH